MFCVILHAGLKFLALFLDCSVIQSLIKIVSLLLSALPQLFHVLDLVLANMVLQNPPQCIVDGV